MGTDGQMNQKYKIYVSDLSNKERIFCRKVRTEIERNMSRLAGGQKD